MVQDCFDVSPHNTMLRLGFVISVVVFEETLAEKAPTENKKGMEVNKVLHVEQN